MSMNNEFTPELIVLSGLAGNEPTHLKGLQTVLFPYEDFLIGMWATLFCVTLTVLVVRHIILPLVRGKKS